MNGKKFDLTIMILTFELDGKKKENKVEKYMPKVCGKFGDKTMIEIAIENSLRLNPDKIILYVYKNNIEYINRILKRKPYSKLLSYCMLNCLDKIKYKNLLVIPGNAPLLTVRTLHRIIGQNRDIKINNSLFYLKDGQLNNILDMSVTREFLISQTEINKIENQKDLENIKN